MSSNSLDQELSHGRGQGQCTCEDLTSQKDPLFPVLPVCSQSISSELTQQSHHYGWGLAAQSLEPIKARVWWLNIVLAGWLGPRHRPRLAFVCCQQGDESLRRGRKPSTGPLGPSWSSKDGVCSRPALLAALHPVSHNWSICKAVSPLHVCLSMPVGWRVVSVV